MRILHYMFGIPPVRGGGLVRYASDLMRWEKKMGGDVFLLIPGRIPKNREKQVKIHKAGSYMQIPAYEIFHPLPVPMGNGILDIEAYTRACDGFVYADFLRQARPDIIHIHSLMGLHREFFIEAGRLKLPSVFTTHDYFGLCPAAHMVPAGGMCSDAGWKCCWKCCQNAYTDKRLRLEQSRMYQIYRKNDWIVHMAHSRLLRHRLRPLTAPEASGAWDEPDMGCAVQPDYAGLKKYYEDMFGMTAYFHFNSSLAQKIYRSRLAGITGSVLGISHEGICDRRRSRTFGSRLRIGYFGNWSAHKGFGTLLEACRQLYEEGCRDMELHVYSNTDVRREKFVRNHPHFRQEQLPDVAAGIDVLAVPSICPETFGFVVLEALSFGIPVILSENVGARDILSAHPKAGFVYDGTLSGLKACLGRIYRKRMLLEQANAEILKMDYDFSFETHVGKILDMYRRLCGRSVK